MADPAKENTGVSEVTGTEPPTYACVGTSDGIAYYEIMEERIRQIQARGTNAEIEVFDGLPHGFGLGEGTVAEGWLDRAVEFWEENMSQASSLSNVQGSAITAYFLESHPEIIVGKKSDSPDEDKESSTP